jgi:hypothetical protein
MRNERESFLFSNSSLFWKFTTNKGEKKIKSRISSFREKKRNNRGIKEREENTYNTRLQVLLICLPRKKRSVKN